MDTSKYTLDGLPVINVEAGESFIEEIEKLKISLRDYLDTKLKLIKNENSLLEELLSERANNEETMSWGNNKDKFLLGAVMVYELMRKQMVQNSIDDITTHPDEAPAGF